MHVRPCLAIIQDNKILLLKYNYSGNDVFGLPGGNPEPGDTLAQTVTRELKEELNLEVTVENLLLTGEVIFLEKGLSTLHCLFSGSITSGVPQINPAETSALKAVWVEVDKIDSLNLYPNVGRELKELLTTRENRANPYIGRINQQWF
jgi:ADP-ribose pyrophosphatase YjhB (NUDIX family)